MKYDFYSSRRFSLAVGAMVASALLASCKDDNNGPGTGATPATVAVSTAPAATSTVATAIPGPAVLVTDAGGSPVAGVQVKFTVAGGGIVQFPIATTDASGIASAGYWQIGPKVGSNVVTATVEGLAPVTFTVASQAGPAAALGAFSGNGQSGAPGSTLAAPVVVRITDAGGNVKPGATVTFAVTGGGGSVATASTTTDASGLARTNWTLGSGQCGQTVRATSGTLVADFTASSRGTVAVDGNVSGTLATGDCVIAGALADEYDLTTGAGAVNFLVTGATGTAVTSDGAATIATGASGTAFRVITAAGSKAIRATGTGPYSIAVSTASSDVNACGTVYLEVGASTTQTLSASDCKTNGSGGFSGDAFLVWLQAGISYRFSQTAIPLDAELFLFSPTGALLADRDNGGVGAGGTEVINITPTTSGFYKVVPSSYCGVFNDVYQANCDLGPYTLTVIRP
jgi:hypothetical protein